MRLQEDANEAALFFLRKTAQSAGDSTSRWIDGDGNTVIRTLGKCGNMSLLGMEHALGETLQGQRYTQGQQFKHHFDYFVAKHAYWDLERNRGGQRSWTAMGYLNPVEDGGATDFPKIGLSIPPKAGVLLIWNNMLPDGRPNPRTLPAGTPVIGGVKYVLTKWYRERPWC